MATKYATLKDSNGDIIYPQISTDSIANNSITSSKIDWTTISYSSTPQVVGTWTNGKPIYRKVIESTQFLQNPDYYPVDSNIEQFIDQWGYVQRKDYPNVWQYIPSRIGSTMSISFLASSRDAGGGIQIDWGSSWTSSYSTLFNKIVLVVDYTKTTD